MPLKKQPLNDNEIPIYDEALIYQRGEYWQMRMWLTKEGKYARFSLRTRNRDTAIDKAKKRYHELMAQQLANKTYFSMTTKQGVEEYVKQRQKDMEAGLIVKGRLGTIKTHLSHPKYRPDIDGLRAVAVLAVVAFHAFPSWVRGGFIGVDIFFVISGYLISTIIFENLDKGTFSFTEFYSRRIRRIFPALLLVLIACFAFGWFALLADEYKQLGKHIAGVAGFISNFTLWNEAGYFDNSAENKPLLHLWSLAIEEQFYILWPLLLWLAWKRKFNLLTITIVVAIASFVLNIKGIKHDLVATFYSPQTRFWELLSGSLLAWVTLYKKDTFANVKLKLDYWLSRIIHSEKQEADGKTLSNVLSFIGLLLLVYGFWRINKELSFPGKWALVPVLGAVLIITAGSKAWVNRKILSNKVAVWFGLISFPLYLWHWPLLSFARIVESEVPSRNIRIAAVVLSIVLAWLTYKLVERPLRFGKHSKAKVTALVLLMASVGYVGFNTYDRNGLSFRNEAIERNLVQVEYEKSFYSNQIARNSYPNFDGFYAYKSKNLAPTVMILGDSFANRLLMGLSQVDNSDVFLHLSNHWCPEFLDLSTSESHENLKNDKCAEYANYAINVAETSDSIKTIVFYFRGGLYLSASRKLSLKNSTNLMDPSRILESSIRKTFDRFSRKDKNLIFVYANPEITFDPKSCEDLRPYRIRNKILNHCRSKREDFEKSQSHYRGMMSKILKDYPQVKTLDTADIFCDKDFCYATKDNSVLYSDSNHLSLSGSILVANKLLPLIVSRQR